MVKRSAIRLSGVCRWLMDKMPKFIFGRRIDKYIHSSLSQGHIIIIAYPARLSDC